MRDPLNSRQSDELVCNQEIVRAYGKYNQSTDSDGAHYILASANPFTDEGLVCDNCVHFLGRGRCEIVSGFIEEHGLCKKWIIPESRMIS